jgi:hypothetical protein
MMAERFGGKYSPGPPGPAGDATAQPARASKMQRRTTFLFFVAIPFALTAFGQDPIGLIIDLTAFAALILAAWLTRDGVIAAEAWAARRVARRPMIPRKLFGTILTALGLFMGGFVPGQSLLNPVIFAVLGAALHAFAFGPDPMKDKGIDGIDPFQQDRVARVVDEAEKHLAAMREAVERVGDARLTARVDRFQATARQMFRTVEEDPRDLTAARTYLGVYLMGARDATVKFADLWTRSRDAGARTAYEALLDDLEAGYTERTKTLLVDDRSDLDVEIEVLRDRLARDGVIAEK